MKAVARTGMLVLALCATGAFAKEQYVLRGDYPETGSNINRPMISWPVPPEASYADLTPEQQRFVRSAYVTMGANDEPPYPAYGMAPVLRDVLKLRNTPAFPAGVLHLAVRVDASGQPRGVAVLKTPDRGLANAVSFVLMRTAFKPGRCNGSPCDSDYSFYYEFLREHPHNLITHDWHPTFWVVPLKP